MQKKILLDIRAIGFTNSKLMLGNFPNFENRH